MPLQSLPTHGPPWHLHRPLLFSTFLLTHSLKLPLFGDSSRIPLVPDVHCVCVYFYDCYGNKSNTYNNWEPGGEGRVVFIFSEGQYVGHTTLKNSSTVFENRETKVLVTLF